MTKEELSAAEAARKKAVDTGLTPDVRKVQIRNQIEKAYKQRDIIRNKAKEKQIEEIAMKSSIPIEKMIEMSDSNLKELAKIVDKDPSDTAIAQALRKAMRKKK